MTDLVFILLDLFKQNKTSLFKFIVISVERGWRASKKRTCLYDRQYNMVQFYDSYFLFLTVGNFNLLQNSYAFGVYFYF